MGAAPALNKALQGLDIDVRCDAIEALSEVLDTADFTRANGESGTAAVPEE